MPSKDPEKIKATRRRHYEKHRERMIEQARDKRARQRTLLREHVRAIKEASGCMDCGQRALPHYCLQFDHTADDKVASIADMVSASVSVARMDAEIAKCEVVCANCHAIRTWSRSLIA